MTELFVVGFVRGTHGITGEFKVESASGEYEHFARMEEVTLTDGKENKLFKIESCYEGSGTLYMKLAGISSPEEAAKYRGWQIVVPRSYAHPLQEGEWYIEDLKGLSVVYGDTYKDGTDNNVVGKVTDVKEGGSGYLVEISLSEGCKLLADDVKYTKNGKLRTVYVPFRNEFIGNVDIEAGTMQLMHLWILE